MVYKSNDFSCSPQDEKWLFLHFNLSSMFINLKSRLLSLDTPVVMGILNYTEDSFYDGGRYTSRDKVLKRAGQILEEGAAIIDLGAVSTRPGAADVDEAMECRRVLEALEWILDAYPEALVSIDTWRAQVAREAIAAGAAMINDVSGGTFEPQMLEVVAEAQVPYCLMHTSAKPAVMQQQTHYENILAEMMQFFGKQLATLRQLGANDIIIDPGFGFGKTVEQNWQILDNLKLFTTFNLPLLVGLSRKSMIYKPLGITPEEALPATLEATKRAITNGANILRVHDVAATCALLK